MSDIPCTDRQIDVLVALRAADLQSANGCAYSRRSWSAQDLLDRGTAGPASAIGLLLKGLLKKGLVVMTQAPRARGNRKAKYKLTDAGSSKARRFS